MAVARTATKFFSRSIRMISSSNERPTSGATAALVLCAALPLIILVTAVFVGSVRLKEAQPSEDFARVDSRQLVDTEQPAMTSIATEIAERSTSAETKTEI